MTPAQESAEKKLNEIRRYIKHYEDGFATIHEVLARIQDDAIDPSMEQIHEKGAEWSGTCGSFCGPKPPPPRRAIVTRHANLTMFRRVGNPEVRANEPVPNDRTWVLDEFEDTEGFLTEAEQLVAALQKRRKQLITKLRELFDASAPYTIVYDDNKGIPRVVRNAE